MLPGSENRGMFENICPILLLRSFEATILENSNLIGPFYTRPF